MLLDRMLEVLSAIRFSKEIKVSGEELRFLVENNLALVISDIDYQLRQVGIRKLEAASWEAENAKKEARQLYEQWRAMERLNSFWHRCRTGKEQLTREAVDREVKRKEYMAKELVAGELTREYGRLLNIRAEWLKYAQLDGNWARLTPVGVFARDHLQADTFKSPESGCVHYKNYIQTLFLEAVSELEDRYSY